MLHSHESPARGAVPHRDQPPRVRNHREQRAHRAACADALRRDPHHITEAQYKAVARALRQAVEYDPRVTGVPSTKGTL
jgi:hypothetical protein